MARWLAYTLPYRRFADILADACARLGADVDRYSFIVVDFHHLLLAGLPAHCNAARGLLKRHRDVHFQDVVEDVAPISIIITTLAARSYEYCVNHFTFDSELDVLIATIRLMPHFIDQPFVNGRRIYVVANETTIGENFAERWNTEPARAAAFYGWHAKALADFEALPDLEGIDVLARSLGNSFGGSVVGKVIDARAQAVSQAHIGKRLHVAPAVGPTLSSTANATPVRPNTFFGD